MVLKLNKEIMQKKIYQYVPKFQNGIFKKGLWMSFTKNPFLWDFAVFFHTWNRCYALQQRQQKKSLNLNTNH